MDLGLKGKAVAIVGGSAGMGFAAAEVLVEEGARLAILARDAGRAEEKATILRAKGAEVLAFAADGAVSESVEAAIDRAAQALGGLNALAVTAGPMAKTGPFLEFTDADWDTYYQVILMTTMRSCRAAIPHLQKAGGGQIVVTAAYSIRAPKSFLAPYITMKAGVAALAKNLAVQFGQDGIRVNCVCPGAIATEALDGAIAQAVALYGGPAEAAINRYAKETWGMDVALQRVGRPRELGELYAFLLSERAGYMTGATINADGGTHF